MKVLVTGANGYLGRGIVAQLLRLEHQVIATDFNKEESIDAVPCLTFKEANLFDINDPYTFFEQPDVVLHLAWRDGFVHNSMAHVNDFSKHVAFLQKMFDSDAKRIAVMGSMNEVGFFEGSIDESTPCHPETLYGIAKNAVKDVTIMMSKKTGKSYQWLRGYYIVGNTAKGSSIFSKIVQANEQGKTEFPFTSGQNQYDFLDYDDFCQRVALAVTQDEICGIINVSSGHPEKLADRVERFIKANGFNIKLKYGSFPDRPYDSKAIWGNSNKIEKIISAAN